jgi:protein-tyrosine phosphatase
MPAEIYWIERASGGRLAIMARPRTGDWLRDEIAGWAAENINIVVSLLEPAEVAELQLGEEATLCREQGIDFISFPIADRGIPESLTDTAELVHYLAGEISGQKAVAIHCRAGIGRSAVIAACVMVMLGTEASSAFSLISDARGLKVPDTDEQRHWVYRSQEALVKSRRSPPTMARRGE